MSASTEKKLRQAAREAGTDKKIIAAQEAAKKQAQSKRRWTIGTILVVLLIAAILFLNSGFLYKSTTAVTVGDESYSPAEVNYQYASQYYYLVNQWGSYASLFGLDTNTGLSGLASQECTLSENGGTWKDYLLDLALAQMEQNQAILDYAHANDIELDEEDFAAVESDIDSLKLYYASQGYSSVDNFLAANYGNGVNTDVARKIGQDAALVNKAVEQYSDSLEYTSAELSDYYASYNGEKDYFDLAYYYIAAEKVTDADGNEAVTDETVAAAKAKADEILAAYNALDDEDVELRLNDAIATVDADSQCVHTTPSAGSALGAYKEWAMDSSRKAGDATVSENSTGDGFYVVAYIARNDNNYKLAQVRHILVKAEADENGVYTDEAKAAAKAKAEELLAEWKAGDATEESFAVMAEANSEDAGSNTNGGLYDSVRKNQMVDEFDEFCFAGHKHGDTAIVYGESSSYAGYHIMYYVGEGQLCKEAIAEDNLRNTDLQNWVDELMVNYEAVPTFWVKLVG